MASCKDCGAFFEVEEVNEAALGEQDEMGRPIRFNLCVECNKIVFAVGPINGEGPFFMAYTEKGLRAVDRDELSFGQCEDCGRTDYLYLHGQWQVVCLNPECTAAYPVRALRTYAVVM
jgi:hypothetical protein